MPGFVFSPDMGFQRYVDWACAVPMYSVVRGGRHLALTHRTFGELLAGAERSAIGPLTEADFALQLNALLTLA